MEGKVSTARNRKPIGNTWRPGLYAEKSYHESDWRQAYQRQNRTDQNPHICAGVGYIEVCQRHPESWRNKNDQKYSIKQAEAEYASYINFIWY